MKKYKYILESLFSEKGKKEIMGKQKKICFDFDGVIHRYSKGYLNGEIYDPPVKGIVELIRELKSNNFFIVILTSRVSKMSNPNTYIEEHEKVKSWLEFNDIPYDLITAEKLAAIAYIDDKAIRFYVDSQSEMRKIRKNIEDLLLKENHEHCFKN